MNVLVINAGSSSLKYQLVNVETQDVLAKGICERVGSAEAFHKHGIDENELVIDEPMEDHNAAMAVVLQALTSGPNKAIDSLDDIDAIGHRVVQGGSTFPDPALVTDETIKQVEDLAVLAPLHNGPEAKGAEVMRELLPDVPQIFVFDSSFFQQLPKAASTYALNREVAEKYKIRRYGAHGTSHWYVSSKVPEVIGKPAEGLKQIVLHIGNGASASAEIDGKPIETSMGLTPLEGLVMGSRTGDIDPAAVFHLIRNAHMDVDELDDLFNKKSGMMGMTGFGDMREVHRLIAEGDENAKLALDVYVHRIVSYIGAYTAQLGGLDVITFTAGVGENDEIVRRKETEFTPMTEEEALIQIDLLGHDFFAYTDRDTNLVHILYRRTDGGYGLLTQKED